MSSSFPFPWCLEIPTEFNSKCRMQNRSRPNTHSDDEWPEGIFVNELVFICRKSQCRLHGDDDQRRTLRSASDARMQWRGMEWTDANHEYVILHRHEQFMNEREPQRRDLREGSSITKIYINKCRMTGWLGSNDAVIKIHEFNAPQRSKAGGTEFQYLN